MLLQGKKAIVSGATRGIGKAILYRLAREGCMVAGIYRSSDDSAAAITAELAAEGCNVRLYKGSVTDRAFVSSCFREAAECMDGIDIVVNNAGVTRDKLVPHMSEQDWSDVFDTNYLGTLYGSLEAVPYLLARGGGTIINMISVSGLYGREGQANYCASKGAVIGLTRLLSRTYAQRGISVHAVAPGLIETEMADAIPQGKAEQVIGYTNAGRAGTADEVAGNVLYLASGLAGYCTNTVLKVDGGLMR